MKNFIFCIILPCCLLFASCVKKPSNYTARDFVVVDTTISDTAESLAQTYLQDSRKTWMILEFNKLREIKPGERIIVPLKPFNRGGLYPEGYQTVPVLCFGLNENKEPNDKSGGRLSGKESFDSVLSYLKKNGYHVVSMGDFMGFIDYKGQLPQKSVIITLDDQSPALTEWVLPALEAYGYPATVFVDVRDMEKENMLTFEGIRPFLSKGITLGSRAGWTVDSDIEQKQTGLKEYFESMEREIAYSKSTIEKETGKTCLYYAYPPSGNYNILVNLIKKYGFRAGFTLNGESNPFYADSFAVHRFEIPSTCTTEELEKKLVVFKTMGLR